MTVGSVTGTSSITSKVNCCAFAGENGGRAIAIQHVAVIVLSPDTPTKESSQRPSLPTSLGTSHTAPVIGVAPACCLKISSSLCLASLAASLRAWAITRCCSNLPMFFLEYKSRDFAIKIASFVLALYPEALFAESVVVIARGELIGTYELLVADSSRESGEVLCAVLGFFGGICGVINHRPLLLNFANVSRAVQIVKLTRCFAIETASFEFVLHPAALFGVLLYI